MISLLISLLFIALCGFFSCIETAVTKVDKNKIYSSKFRNNFFENTAFKVIEHRNKLIGSVLIVNNFLNIIFSSITIKWTIVNFGQNFVPFATVILAVIILVFGEILPKNYAIRNSEKIILKSSPFIYTLYCVLNPLTIMIQRLVDFILSGGNKRSVFDITIDPQKSDIFHDSDNYCRPIAISCAMFDKNNFILHKVFDNNFYISDLKYLNYKYIIFYSNSNKIVAAVSVVEFAMLCLKRKQKKIITKDDIMDIKISFNVLDSSINDISQLNIGPYFESLYSRTIDLFLIIDDLNSNNVIGILSRDSIISNIYDVYNDSIK